MDVKKLLLDGERGLLVWSWRVLLFGFFFWIRAEFVSKDDYLREQSEQLRQQATLTSTLTHISDALDHLNKLDDDQEARIRILEKENRR